MGGIANSALYKKYTHKYCFNLLSSCCYSGNIGIAVKVAGAVAALVTVYIIGYVTGYHIHRCP